MYPRILGRVERHPLQFCAQYASIFRLLLKVAVKGTHQCDFFEILPRVIPQSIAANAARTCTKSRSNIDAIFEW